MSFALAAICCCAPSLVAQPVLAQAEESVIHYDSSNDLRDPVTRLQEQLTSGKVRLKFDSAHGYLPAVLKALHVPISSQGLVFSKTSSQADFTSPKAPRAIYFSDDVTVGWTPGAPQLDLAAIDPNRGPIFYTLEQKPKTEPRFVRRQDCMQCHFGVKTLNVPALIVRSVYTGVDGIPLGKVDGFVNGHGCPIERRWGGWYVTGSFEANTEGSLQPHLGNVFAADPAHPECVDTTARANLKDLRPFFEASRYLSSGSDIVALLILEHQIRMLNLLTYANYETRYALRDLAALASGTNSDDATNWPHERIRHAGEMLVEYMLFRDEAPLKGPVHGTSSFAAEFQRTGPRASHGRSLRQLDLKTRLMRYPCSFLIYSASFDSLPQEMKNYVWSRLEIVLTGQDHSATYSTMPCEDRRNIREILRETKPEFAEWLGQRQDGRQKYTRFVVPSTPAPP